VTATPFETRGGFGTTPLAEETTFLTALAAASGGRLAVDTVGTSVKGNPIRVLRIGYPAAPPKDTRSSRSVLFVGQQHGEEVHPREALFAFARDLAETTDPTLRAYLTAHPVYIMPTCNPDNLGVTAYNANNVNINRDHFKLSQPETRAIHHVIRTYRPHVLHDLHVGGANPVDLQSAYAAQVDTGLRALAADLRDSVITHLTANGVGAGIYPGVDTHLDSEPRMLRDAGGLLNMVALLSEAKSGTGDPKTNATYLELVEWTRETLRGVQVWHAAHAAEAADMVTAAEARAVEAGRSGVGPFSLGKAGGSIPLPPLEYWLTPADYDAAKPRLDLLGITATRKDEKWWSVSLAQPAYSVIPYALDPDSTEAIVPARRVGVTRLPAGATIDRITFRSGGRDLPVRMLAQVTGGAPAPVWQRL